jgi:uncharacterized membrane protein
VSPEDQQRLDAMADALARMVRRQTELEQRLARIEAALHVPPPAEIPPEPAAPARPGPPQAALLALPQLEPASRRIETAFGLTLLSRIGVITVVLALAFFFEYAFENHWITEWGRAALGIVCGAASLLFGERMWRGGQRTFGQALTAAGVGFLYLSVWASFGLYHLIGQPVAFSLFVLVTAAAGALALRYEGPAIAALGLAGGYITPPLLGNEQSAWFVLSYALVLNLGAGAAVRLRSWGWLEGLALAGTIALYGEQVHPGSRGTYTLFLCFYYAQFVLAPLPPISAMAQILAGAALVGVWAPAGSVLVLVLAITIAGLAVADQHGWSESVGASFAGFWMAYGLWHGPGVATPLMVLTASFAVFLAWPLRRASRALRLTDLAVLALNPAFYFGAGYSLLEPGHRGYEGLFAVGAAAMAAGTARLLWHRDSRGGWIAAGMAAALLVLAAPIQLVGYRVTLAWALEAAAITWIGARLRQPLAIYSAGAVFVMVLLRLALIDSRMYSGFLSHYEVANARFLVFAVSAAGLCAAAWWSRKEPRFALPAYVGGHAVLLWGLGLEVVEWAERTATPQNLRSVVSTSISVLVAVYAVALVAAGVLHRHLPTRVLGVALIGSVVLKLYLYDVWLLGQFYRMAAFAILGVLLLLMSYFYSRFRHSLEGWWRS